MGSNRHHVAVYIVCAAWPALGWVSQSRGDEPDIELLAAYRTAAEASEADLSPLSVTWVQRFVPVNMTEEQALARLNLGEQRQFFAPQTCTFSWQDGKAILTTHRTRPDGTAEVKETSYDGRTFFHGTKRSDYAFLQKTTVENAFEMNMDGYPVLPHYIEAIGLAVPPRYAAWSKPYLRPELLQRLDNGAQLRSVTPSTVGEIEVVKVVVEDANHARLPKARGQQLLDGLELTNDAPARKRALRDAVQLRMSLPETRMYAYYVDPLRAYAVVQSEEYYAPDTLLIRRVCDSFTPLRGVWLPQACRVQLYELMVSPEIHDNPVLIQDFRVSDVFGASLATDDFRLAYDAPGTEILDGTGDRTKFDDPHGIRYRVPGAIADFDRAADAARRPRRYLLLANMVILVVVGIIVVARALMKRRS